MSATTASIHRPGHVIELDGLRGLLAVCVALSHIVLWCGFAEPPVGGRGARLYGSFIYAQWTVEVFFILSGFAISYLIHTQQPTFTRFMIGRFFRIYPVYLFCAVLGLAALNITPFVLETATWRETSYFSDVRTLLLNEQSAPWQHWLAHLTLLNGALPKDVLPGAAATVLVPAWSISVEWQFYLCALLLARFVRSALGILALGGIAWLGVVSGQAWINPMPAFLPLVLPLFLIGIGSYHLYATFVAVGARRSRRYTVIVAAALAATLLLRWHTLALVIWIAAFGSLFLERSSWFARPLCALRATLAYPFFQFLGRISYPLYLVHWPLLIALLALLLYFKPAMLFSEALTWLLLAGLPLMIGAAYLLHRVIEAPFMRLGKRLSSSRSPAPLGTHAPALPKVGLATASDKQRPAL